MRTEGGKKEPFYISSVEMMMTLVINCEVIVSDSEPREYRSGGHKHVNDLSYSVFEYKSHFQLTLFASPASYSLQA